MIRNLVVGIISLVVMLGCASPYKPSQNVLSMKSSMQKEEAQKIVVSMVVNPTKGEGICRANGHPDAGLSDAGWQLSKKSPEVKYNKDGFSFNALKEALSISTHGNVATGTYSNTTTRMVPFRRDIKYTDFDEATIFYEMNALNRVCFFKKGYAEVRINLHSGFGHWISVLVKNENLEKFIAAMMIAAPQTVFQTK